MIKNFEPRLYQQTIFGTIAKANTLVVLPTGMGKTMLAIMLAAKRLKDYPDSKILMVAPTKPLVEQHVKSFLEHLDCSDVVAFTGTISPAKRKEMWDNAKVIISTPQGLENDVLSRRISLENVSAFIFDEAHRATGNYAYVFLAEQYVKQSNKEKILAMTASPGSDMDSIKIVCKNLHIDEVESRDENDGDVKPYVQETKIEWVKVKLSEPFLQIKKLLEDCYKSKLKEIKELGYLNNISINKIQLLKLSGELRGKINSGEKDFEIWRSISLSAEALKIQHGLELLETQGISALWDYMRKMEGDAIKGKSKAVKNLVNDVNYKSARIMVDSLNQNHVEHPKLTKLKEIVGHIKRDEKYMIFNQYRDNAKQLCDQLNSHPNIRAALFVGQTKKNNIGLTQKEQKEMIEKFRSGEFNVLISTSVGEEGLDIPKVDKVIFYEPVPSAIRHIQRKGRTGRNEKGAVIILYAEGTRDVGYRWSAFHKQKRMYKNLKGIKGKFQLIKEDKKVTKLTDFDNDVKVYVDYREKGSNVMKNLMNSVNLVLDKLGVGDYVLSERLCVEYKNQEDFVNSIIDGRILEQAKQMKRSFARNIVIVEGDNDIYSIRNINENSIRGMISTLAVSFGISVIFTKNARDTAEMIKVMARREQKENKGNFVLHGDKKPSSLKEQQEFIVGSLPGIGGSLNVELLKKFGSVSGVLNASVEDLKSIDKIGKKKSEEIRKILDSKYSF